MLTAFLGECFFDILCNTSNSNYLTTALTTCLICLKSFDFTFAFKVALLLLQYETSGVIIKLKMNQTIIALLCIASLWSYSQDTAYLKVHFLYGSKPLKRYKDTEEKWFGGMLGGHVGIESDSNRIVNFLPNGKFHWFAKKNSKHSMFAVHSPESFYSIFGGNSDSVKKAIVYIPVTHQQKLKFDSITTAYLKQTPYDYALFGMRCGAAAHDILGKLDILTNYSNGKTYKKIFYPRKLRKRLFGKAEVNGWAIIKHEGSTKRKWEKD